MDSRKSRLNLPAGMETSLHIEPVPTHFPLIPKLSSPSKTTYSDRFIPCRSSSRLQNFGLTDKTSPVKEGGNELYSRLLRAELLGDDSVMSSPGQASPMSPSKNLFRFKTDHSAPSSPFSGAAPGQAGCVFSEVSTPPKVPRKIPKTPHKVLDAPSLQDDFYLNLVDWSSQNVLAVGLGTCVYLWSATTSKVTKLCDLGPRDGVCSVQWTREGSYLAIGTIFGDIQIWDSTRCKKIRTMGGHQTRTGVLAWSSRILSSGGRDKNILQHDIRVSSDFVSKLIGHRSEICGLKWSHDDRELASGGNDNQVEDNYYGSLSSPIEKSNSFCDELTRFQFLVVMYTALGMEPALSTASFETYRAYSCCQSHCLVTTSEWTSCIRRWHSRSMHPFSIVN